MPYPRRESPDQFFELLADDQKPHLTALRRISLDHTPRVTEELKWNQPAYTRDGQNMWMLQAFGKHCSLRFSPDFFSAFVDEVEAAGHECGAGFLKIPYSVEVPEVLCRKLIEAKLAS